MSSILAVLVFSQMPIAAQSTGTLTGKMAPFNYVFGAPWKCTTNLPPMNGQPARTATSTTTFDVAPNNVMHVHIAGDNYMSDQYFGYSTQANTYWSASSDTMGMGISEQSTDGKAYNGVIAIGKMNGTVQDTYNKLSDNKVAIHSVLSMGGKQDATDTTCTR
ncbi:MAG: hypothetical protein ACXWNK_07905 [Vulcanimicrobiaceae bacterium]